MRIFIIYYFCNFNKNLIFFSFYLKINNLKKEKIYNSINLPSIEKKKKCKRILKNNPLKLNYFSKIDMYY